MKIHYHTIPRLEVGETYSFSVHAGLVIMSEFSSSPFSAMLLFSYGQQTLYTSGTSSVTNVIGTEGRINIVHSDSKVILENLGPKSKQNIHVTYIGGSPITFP